MIIFTILVALTFLLGALAIYSICSYAEHKGYERGEKDFKPWKGADE